MGDELFLSSAHDTEPNIRLFKPGLARVADELVEKLEEQGSAAVAVNSVFFHEETVKGDLSLRHCAQDAGLGEIGDNTLLLSPRFGNRLALEAVLTDREIENVPARGYPGRLCLPAGPVSGRVLKTRTVRVALMH